jgi:hypothetical protein
MVFKKLMRRYCDNAGSLLQHDVHSSELKILEFHQQVQYQQQSRVRSVYGMGALLNFIMYISECRREGEGGSDRERGGTLRERGVTGRKIEERES